MKTKLLLLLLVATSFADAQVTNGLIQEFKFDNSYANEAGSVNFASNSGTSFVADRLGNTNSAIQITEQTSAAMSNIPTGTSSRTFSFWYKVSSNSGYPGVFAYGGTNANTKFGMYLGTTGNPIFQLSVNDIATVANLPANVWRHFLITYTSSQIVIYVDGIVLSVYTSPTINTSLSDLLIGNNGTTTIIDDLKIFNRAVSGNEAILLAGGFAGQPIAEYNFNNTLNNISGFKSMYSATTTVYGPDRNNVANNALVVSSSSDTGVLLDNIPVGNAARSVSVWIKPSEVNGDNVFFTYGDPSGLCSATFGGSFNPSNVYNFTLCSNNPALTTVAVNEWKHIVITHSGTTSKIYINGVLTATNALAINTSYSAFSLGSYYSGVSSRYVGSFDDLKIFDYELTQSQASNLFANNTVLSSQNFNQNNPKVSLYPNPATDILNIALENEIQSVEIYSSQGQKVMTANQKQINISSLSKGMYLVKVTDAANNSASQKLIVK